MFFCVLFSNLLKDLDEKKKMFEFRSEMTLFSGRVRTTLVIDRAHSCGLASIRDRNGVFQEEKK